MSSQDQQRQAPSQADAGGPNRPDPLLLAIRALRRRVPRTVWLGLAALALLGTGAATGTFISSRPGAPSTEQALVTWVNEGLPPPIGSGGPAQFAARLNGASQTANFTLSDTAEWTTAGNAGWTMGTMPPCMIPLFRGRPAHHGLGHVRVQITMGVVHVQLPDGQTEDLVVWVKCP
jgi:hypothetical protein